MAKSDERIGWARVVGGCAIVLAGCLAYANSFSVPLVFDDAESIQKNPTIRHLWPMGSVLRPPGNGSPVTGRPVVNLSLAINYALGGTRVSGYHLFNLSVQILAALTLFGIVRRTLAAASRGGPAWICGLEGLPPVPIAAAAALVWIVHPLQSEAVTYVSGRTESLMGLFYLLTLYGFIRATQSPEPAAESEERTTRHARRSRTWLGVAVATCLAGMGTKEVMATAPLIVFLYDRTFVSGSFREAWRKRRYFYVLLGGTWLLLAWLVAGSGTRGGTVGFSTRVSWGRYAEIQVQAIAHYLRLSFWPHPLAIDYGWDFVGSPSLILTDGLVGALLAATAVALWRAPVLGFLGAWFFVILAPSSSIIPVATEPAAEHRMYLPLAAICVLAVVALYRGFGRRSFVAWIGIAAGLALLTARRNEDYRTVDSLWRATVRAYPRNAGAHNNLGGAFLAAGNWRAAIPEFEEALKLDPLMAGVHNNLGLGLGKEGREDEAAAQFEEAVRLAPTYQEARVNLAATLLQLGRFPEAIAQYAELLRLRPRDAGAHRDLALAMDKAERLPEAIVEYEEALRIDPGDAEGHYDLGNVLVRSRRLPPAIKEFEQAVRLRPGYAEAKVNLGGALLETGRLQEAIVCYEEALRLNPNLVEAQVNLGSAFLETGRPEPAIDAYRAALRIRPDYATAHHDLGVALQSVGRLGEAAAEFEMASRTTGRQ
jgi:protein O-mannosyl-transferase